MQKELLPQAERYARQHKGRRLWRKVVRVMACFVVFCTTYALILPAITMEKTACALEEHVHSESCYTKQTVQQVTKLLCSCESGGHVHTQECRGAENELICGYADFVVHTHGAYCYDADGALVCQLPEIVEHEHTEECYVSAETETLPVETEVSVHTHDESCYTVEQGELICETAEAEGHTHTDECYIQGELECGLEESEGHTHGDGCSETILVCELTVEPHVHTDGCYQQLVCELPEDENHAHGEDCSGRVLVCDLTEQPHAHTDSCWQTNSLCGLPESEGHVHSTACYASQLTCVIEESEGHAHDDSCYEQIKTLTCETEEETSGEETAAEAEEEPAEEAEPELVCEKEEIILHTHVEYTCYENYVDENGEAQKRMICPELEVREHIHSESCLVTEEIPVDTESLTCTQAEAHVHGDGCYDEAGELICTESTEGHTHSEMCYGTWVLSCELEEHTHNEECTPEPAVTYYCGLEEHAHAEECSDEEGNLICELEEHSHSEECTWALSEEERAAVEEVEALIEPLPTYDEIMAKLDEFYEADDTEGEEAYLTEVYAQVEEAYRAYMALPEEHREYVSNADKLMELDFIWSRVTLEETTRSYNLEGSEYYYAAIDNDFPRYYQWSSYGIAYEVHAFALIPGTELEDGEWTPTPVAWNGKANANYIVAYCADDRTTTSPSDPDTYSTYSIDNSRFTTDLQQRKIAAIIGNSYPFLTLAEARAVMSAAGVEGAEQCTEHELLTATQWAVWATVETVSHLEESDICNVTFGDDYLDTTVNPLAPAATLEENPDAKTRIINVKNWLCSIAEPIRLAVTGYEPVITANEDGTFDLSVTVNLNREIEPDEHAQFNLVAGSISTTMTQLPAGEDSFVISAENLSEGELANAKISLNISGEHMQAYFFDSMHYQDMVSGNWEHYSDDLSFELGLDLIDVAVTKVWAEENTTIDSIDVQLLANGKPYGDPVTLSKNNDWHYIWEDLKRYSITEVTKEPEDRTEIEYSIMEIPLPGFYSSDLTVDSFESVEKIEQWQEVETFDGPGQYVFVSDTGALSAEYNSNPPSNWPGNHFISLAPVNLSSATLTEDRVIWNVAEYDDQYSIESVKYPGWYMNGSRERVAQTPSKHFFSNGLLGCGSEYFGGFYSNGYQYYTSNMNKVMYFRLYKLVELELPSVDKNFVLTNTLIPEGTTVDVSVTKKWTGRPDNVYPESVTVQLMQTDVYDGTEKPYGYPVVLSEENQWTHMWNGMPEYILENGTYHYINYSVVETDASGDYVSTFTSGTENSYAFTLTNTWNPRRMSVELQKIGGADSRLLSGAEFDLYLITNQVGDPIPGAEDFCGHLMEHIVVGESGKVMLELALGETYCLVETKAPAGYFLLEEPVAFTVGSAGATVNLTVIRGREHVQTVSGTTAVLKIENKCGYELPATGGAGTSLYTTGGLLLMMAAAVLLYIHNLKRRKEERPSF